MIPGVVSNVLLYPDTDMDLHILSQVFIFSLNVYKGSQLFHSSECFWTNDVHKMAFMLEWSECEIICMYAGDDVWSLMYIAILNNVVNAEWW